MTGLAIHDESRIYLAPAGTLLPASHDDLERGGQWLDVGTPVERDLGLITADPPRPDANRTWHLDITYQLPEPYRPNRSARRAAARAAKRGHR